MTIYDLLKRAIYLPDYPLQTSRAFLESHANEDRTREIAQSLSVAIGRVLDEGRSVRHIEMNEAALKILTGGRLDYGQQATFFGFPVVKIIDLKTEPLLWLCVDELPAVGIPTGISSE
jgi:hypothetical protein